MFIGEAVEATDNPIEALAYHSGRYWKTLTSLEKPSQEELDKINGVVEKYKK